ncbi:MAG: phycobilisome rod-core linker polypeptide [Cyanobacteria bacterium P01_C01_bin.118]
MLGRSPDSAAEIAEHIQILVEQGFDAEVDSYLNSNE